MKGDRDTVRADLARLGPTLFVQEYHRRGWSDGELSGSAADKAAAERETRQ